jgi:subtilisin family serine protease
LSVRRLAAIAALLVAGCAALPPRVPVTPLPEEARTTPAHYVVVTVRDPALGAPPRAAATARRYDGGDSYLPGAAARAASAGLARDYSLRPVSSWAIRVLGVHCLVYELPGEALPAEAIARLAADSRVESVEALQSFTAQALAYNDPYRPMQRNLDTLAVEQAAAFSTGKGIRVAVIDTGVDLAHADLPGARIHWRNFVDADARRFRADRHGTEVAGVIAATTNNGVGVSGIAPDVGLYVFKACWYAADEARAVCNSYTLAQALAAAIEARVQILNLSLSGPMDPLLSRLVSTALAQGALVVGAAPSDGGSDSFPASVPGVLAVASLSAERAPPAALRAPGADILTLEPGDHYDFVSGNSLATAEVSGVAALVWSRRPDAAPAEVRRWLIASGAGEAGMPRSVNVCAALAAAEAGTCLPVAAGGVAAARAP